MSEYYGVQRSTSLSHYGVKGMKWGVRKAKETKNSKRLARHYKKANRKLQSLTRKADVLYNLEKRKDGPALIGVSAVPIAASVGLPIAAKSAMQKLTTKGKVAAAVNTAAGAGMMGAGIYDAITGSRRTTTKGHNKAVQNVKNWQKEMKQAFKGTKYARNENARPEYNDTYTLYEYGTLGKDKKGRVIPYRVPTVSISGSSLVRDAKSDKAKRIFKQRLIDPPQSQHMSDSKVQLVVHTPSGRGYTADNADRYIKVKKKRK